MINNKIIAIDARMIEMSGIGTYIQHLMGQGIYDYAFGKEEEIRKYDKDVKVIAYDASVYSPKEQAFFPNKEAKQAEIRLIHFPHYNVPFSYHGDFVVTVHDLTHIILPEFLGNKLKVNYAKKLMKHALNKSEHIFTVSNNSKKDICNIFNINPDKISLTYDAVDSEFRKIDKQETEYLYEKYKIPHSKTLLLYVGNLKPHKNLGRLLEAFANLNKKEEFSLILAGKAFTGLELEEQEKNLGIDQLVVHTGLLSKEELIHLYNLVDLFVFPSLYEGFGIPPLEAMACGTPVICANNSSIPEVVSDAAVLFDALDVMDIKNAIEKVSGNQDLINELVLRGEKRVLGFSWENTISEVRDSIGRIVSE